MGGQSSSVYDAKNQLISTTDFIGRTETYEYDQAGNLTAKTDFMGYQTLYEYDENNNKIAEIDAGGVRTGFAYTENNLVSSITDALGNVAHFKYDALGQKIESIDANGISKYFKYDALGRLVRVIDANGGNTQYKFDPIGNLTSIIDVDGHRSSFVYDDANRLVKEFTPLKLQYQYSYDAVGNKVSERTPNGYTINFSHYANNNLKQAIYPDNTISYTYNANDMPAEIKDNSGTITRVYDAANRLFEESSPNGNVKYTYSGADRSTMTYPDGKILRYEYTNHRLNRITDWNERNTAFEYTAAGLIKKITYPNGAGIEYEYDVANRLLAVQNFGINDRELASFKYELDAVGNRTQVIRQYGGQLSVEHIVPSDNKYRIAAELSHRTHPNGSDKLVIASGVSAAGVLTVAPLLAKNNWPILFSDPHNLDRSAETKTEIERLVSGQTDPKVMILGNVHSVSDVIDIQLSELSVAPWRITAKNRFEMANAIASLFKFSTGDGIQTDARFKDYAIIVNGLDDSGATAAAAFAAKFGVPILLAKPNEIPEPTVNALNQSGIKNTLLVGSDLGSEIKTWLDGNGYSVAKTFESSDPIVNQVDLWEFAGNVDFDTLYFVDQANYTDVIAASVLSAPKGAILLLTNSKEPSAKVKQFLSKNAYHISKVFTIGGKAKLFEKVTSYLQTFRTKVDTVNYAYDNLYQLIEESYSNGNTIKYSYDAVGNRLSKTENGETIQYTYDADDRLQTAGNASFEFDANGNRTKLTEGNNTTIYNYDTRNKLVSVKLPNNVSNSFAYDAIGRRIQKIDSKGMHNYAYDMDDLAIEKNTASTIQNYFVSGLGVDDWLYSIANDTAKYYQKDGLSSIVALSDSAGLVETSVSYDGFGNVQNNANKLSGSITFTGREMDEETGLYFYRSRYYDARSGVFLKRDTYKGDYENPLSMHRFSYVENNPIISNDPFGYCKNDIAKQYLEMFGINTSLLPNSRDMLMLIKDLSEDQIKDIIWKTSSNPFVALEKLEKFQLLSEAIDVANLGVSVGNTIYDNANYIVKDIWYSDEYSNFEKITRSMYSMPLTILNVAGQGVVFKVSSKIKNPFLKFAVDKAGNYVVDVVTDPEMWSKRIDYIGDKLGDRIVGAGGSWFEEYSTRKWWQIFP